MKCGRYTCLHTQITVMSTFLHDPSLQMGLNKMNYSEKKRWPPQNLRCNSDSKRKHKGTGEKVWDCTPASRGQNQPSLDAKGLGVEDVQDRSSSLLLCSVMSKQVTAALQKEMVRWDETALSTLREHPPKCWLYWSSFSREKTLRMTTHETQSLFLLKIGGLLTALPRLLRTFWDCSPLWS